MGRDSNRKSEKYNSRLEIRLHKTKKEGKN